MLLLLLLFLAPATSGQLSDPNDLSIMTTSEDFGKWRISFNWSDMDEYVSSVSHSDSTSGKVDMQTDAMTLASPRIRSRILKVSVTMYSRRDPSQINMSSMTALANSTLVKSNVCQEIDLAQRLIDGKRGISASGQKCTRGESIYVAVFPVVYHLDRPNGVLASDAIGLVLSTYDQQVTERFLNSVKIAQIK